MTILTDTLVEKGTIYETNSPTDQQINMTYNSQSYIYTHMTSGADPETLLTWGGGGGGAQLWSNILNNGLMDGTNCSSKAVLACRSVNLVFISFSV